MITPEQLCVFLSRHDGEEVTDLKQVAKISFSGGELLEFINSLPQQIELKGGTKYHAKNIPTGEDWVIIGVSDTHLCAAGWPATMCELKYMTDFEEIGPLDESEIAHRTKHFGEGWK